jgi:site-specific recombinase XerD
MMQMTTTQSLQLFLRALQGQNFSPKTLRAYGDDLRQFHGWVENNRVDWDNPTCFTRGDIEGFMQYLASQRRSGVTRVRKLAALRKFFTFLEENTILAANPAHTVKGARREEKEPTILFKEQYKALLYEASENIRDYAIIQTFLQTGIRLRVAGKFVRKYTRSSNPFQFNRVQENYAKFSTRCCGIPWG